MNRSSTIAKSKSNSVACSKINRSFRKNSPKVQRRTTKKRGVYVERFINPFVDDVSETSINFKEQKNIIDLLLKRSSKSSTWPKPVAVEENLQRKSNKKNKNSKHNLKSQSLSFSKNNKFKHEKYNMPEIHEYSKPVMIENKPSYDTVDALNFDQYIGMDRINKEINDGLLCISKSKHTQDTDDGNSNITLESITLDTVEEELKAYTQSKDSLLNSNIIDEKPSTLYKSVHKQPIKKPVLMDWPARYPKKQKTSKQKILKKLEVLNELRQQLETSKIYYQEPQNFFESLLLNMRNKQKAVEFDEEVEFDMTCLL